MSSKTMFAIVAAGFVAVVLGCGSVPPSETPPESNHTPTAPGGEIARPTPERGEIEISVHLETPPEEELRAGYLERTIEPCTVQTSIFVNPCVTRNSTEMQIDAGPSEYEIDVSFGDPPSISDLFDEHRFGENDRARVYDKVPHLVIRGVGIPGTTRCAESIRAGFWYHPWIGSLPHGDPARPTPSGPPQIRRIYCYLDFSVHEYVVGAGPEVLTVAVFEFETLPSQDENAQRIRSMSNSVEAVYQGYEFLMMLTHVPTSATESFFGIVQFDVQLGGSGQVLAYDGGVVARHVTPYPGSRRDLDDLVEEIKSAHNERILRTEGRIGADPSLPDLMTDAHELHDFYLAAKTFEHPYVTPQPAPPPPEEIVLRSVTVVPVASTPIPLPPTPTPLPETIQAAYNLQVVAYSEDSNSQLYAEVGWCAKDPRIQGFNVYFEDEDPTTANSTQRLTKGHYWFEPPQFLVKRYVIPGATFSIDVETLADTGPVERTELTFTVPLSIRDHITSITKFYNPCEGISTPIPSE